MFDNLKIKSLFISAGLIIVTAIIIIFAYTALYNPLLKLELTFVWPEYKGKLTIIDSATLKEFVHYYKDIELIAGELRDEDKYYKVHLKFKKGEQDIYLSKRIDIYIPERSSLAYSPYVKSFFSEQILKLENELFGKIIRWDDIAGKIPRGTGLARVRDLETGYEFTIKRFGGVTHADIEPLESEDTQILKEIYGSWSWKRRAAVVTIDNTQYAASINGMPHGGGAIWDNDFRGHFCLHFLGSKVHASRKVDPGHQLMIHKAGGKIPELLDQSSPSDLTEFIFAAIVSEDIMAIRYLSHNAVNKRLWEELNKIRFIRINSILEEVQDKVNIYVAVDATIYYEDTANFKRVNLVFNFKEDRIRDGWRFDSNTLEQLL